MTINVWLREGFISFVIFVIFWAIARSSFYTLSEWIPKLAKKTKTELDDRLVEVCKTPLYYLILFIGLYLAFDNLPLRGGLKGSVNGILFILLTASGTFLCIRIIQEAISWYGDNIAIKTDTTLDEELLPLFKKVAVIVIILLGIIFILKHFDQDIFTLVTAFGVGSLAVGLAAKDTIANMISGFIIMIDRPFRPGDRVQLASGEIGDVEHIGIRSTKIKTYDNTILVVPNSEMSNNKVININYPDSKIKSRIEVGIAYGSDIEKAKRIMIEAALSIPVVLNDPEPVAFFLSFGDSALNLLLIFWVENYRDRLIATDMINSIINERYNQEGIEIPFPIRTIYHRESEGDR
ncbi:MAG: mechanosensitive ion channel family protein [Nitrospinota bacterium]